MGNKLFRQNVTMHVLAILLAIALWSYVKTADFSARTETSVNWDSVPLEIRDIPVGLRLTNELPQTVNVLLRGSASVLEQVLKENVLAYVSLSDASEGVGQYVVKVIHPQGLNATPTPGRIEVRLERELTADFDLQLQGLKTGDQSEHFSATATPAFVKVTGLRSSFERVWQAQVIVNVASIKQSSTLQLPVKLLDVKGNEVTGLLIEPGVVEVDVVRSPGKLLPVVADLQGQLPNGHSLESSYVEPESVYVYAPAEILATLEQIYTEPISLGEFTEDASLSVKLSLPNEAVASSREDVQVKLKVSK